MTVNDLIRELQAWGVTVVMSDPWADAAEFAHEYGLTLGTVDAQTPVDSLVVAVGHHEYRDLAPDDLRKCCRGDKPVLADVKSLYYRHDVENADFTIFRL